MQFLLLFATAFSSSLLTLANGAYIIDDANSSITYSGGWLVHPPYNYQLVDPAQTMSGTYHVSNGTAAIDIPFKGSGITFMILNVQGLSEAYASVDGGPVTNYSIRNDLEDTQCPNPGCIGYNYSFFSVQGLYSNQSHSLHLIPERTHYFLFDYAIVNDTTYPPGSPSTATKSNLVPIVAGAVGGAAIVAAIVLTILWCRRRPSQRSGVQVMATNQPLPTSPPVSFPVTPYSPPTFPTASYNNHAPMDLNPGARVVSTAYPQPVSTMYPGFSTPTSPQPQPHAALQPMYEQPLSPTGSSLYSPLAAPGSIMPMPSPPPPSEVGTSTNASSSSYGSKAALRAAMQRPPSAAASGTAGTAAEASELTSQQAEFVNGLYHMNVPASAVASVINSMIKKKDDDAGAGPSGLGPGPGPDPGPGPEDDAAPPPAYYAKR